MTTKPTREEVELWKYKSAHSPLHDHAFENHNRLIYLADAYLAQEEELKQAQFENRVAWDTRQNLLKELGQLNADNQELKRKGEQLCCRVGVLEMENQALKASMEAEYIERQAKHIQELVEENERR